MPALFVFSLSAALMLALVGRNLAQDGKPDYAKKSLGKWIEAMKDPERPELRLEARRALGPEGPYAKVAVTALLEACSDKEPPIDSDAADTLASYGAAVVPTLLRALNRPEAGIRAVAAQALGNVRPKPKDAIPALIKALKDPVPNVRGSAACGLCGMGRAAHQAVPSLAAALRDKDDEVRRLAALALLSLERAAKPALPALILALKDEKGAVREFAAQALWRFGPDGKEAVPALIEGLRNKKDGYARWAFAHALGEIGPGAKEAVPALAETLKEKDDLLRPWAASALGQIGPEARAAVPALIAAAKDRSNGNGGRENAMSALGKIGPSAQASVPMLEQALGVRQPIVFPMTAAYALGGIGPAAKAAIPKLMGLIRDRETDEQVRKAAAEAVMKIDPDLAAKENVQFVYLPLRMAKQPAIKLEPNPITEQQRSRIKSLIAKLPEIRDQDFGFAMMNGEAFAPLPDRVQFHGGLLTNDRLQTSDSLRSLIEIGPDALPYLLDALDDKTPTRLKINLVGMVSLGAEMNGNPLNSREKRILSKRASDGDDDHDLSDPYSVKVGDVCFVAIGQIVGRKYWAVRYQPTLFLTINSPVESQALREKVRALWSGKDARKNLFDSLLLDYATEPVFNGQRLDNGTDPSALQVHAAMRLLYYFPKETAPAIAARLRALDVRQTDDDEKRDARNGVDTTAFIKAVSWCKAPEIQVSLADIAKRTNDPEIKAALTQKERR